MTSDNKDESPKLPYVNLIIQMRLFGLSLKEISSYLGEDSKDLQRLYKVYLKLNPDLLDKNKAVEFALFYNAVYMGKVEAQKYWLEKNLPDKYSRQQKEKEVDYDDILKVLAEQYLPN